MPSTKASDLSFRQAEVIKKLEVRDKHLEVLERRAAFLFKRIERAHDGKQLTHDEDELNALNWAIDELSERYK